MKADEKGCIDMMHLPIEETGTVIAAIKKAEKAGDLAALQWCARRLTWLYELYEDDICSTHEPYIP